MNRTDHAAQTAPHLKNERHLFLCNPLENRWRRDKHPSVNRSEQGGKTTLTKNNRTEKWKNNYYGVGDGLARIASMSTDKGRTFQPPALPRSHLSRTDRGQHQSYKRDKRAGFRVSSIGSDLRDDRYLLESAEAEVEVEGWGESEDGEEEEEAKERPLGGDAE